MRGVALRCTGDLQRAAESYQAAADICQEYEDLSNWAVTQANLGKIGSASWQDGCSNGVLLLRHGFVLHPHQGLLCLKAGAKRLARGHLIEALQLFSGLEEEGHEANFITVLLELGDLYLKQQQMHYGKGCFEWALLLAINANLLDCKWVRHTASYRYSVSLFWDIYELFLLFSLIWN